MPRYDFRCSTCGKTCELDLKMAVCDQPQEVECLDDRTEDAPEGAAQIPRRCTVERDGVSKIGATPYAWRP